MVVCDEGVEEVCERGEGRLGRFGAVEIAVVDCFAVGGVAEGGLEGLGLR